MFDIALAIGVTTDTTPEITVQVILDGVPIMDPQVITAQVMSAVSNKILAQGGKGIGYMINQDGSLGEQKQRIIDGAKEIADNISQIADFIIDQYQRQIDKKQEVIDQYNGEIDNLESQLEKEKELRDEGLANNVDVLQKEIEEKKAA